MSVYHYERIYEYTGSTITCSLSDCGANLHEGSRSCGCGWAQGPGRRWLTCCLWCCLSAAGATRPALPRKPPPLPPPQNSRGRNTARGKGSPAPRRRLRHRMLQQHSRQCPRVHRYRPSLGGPPGASEKGDASACQRLHLSASHGLDRNGHEQPAFLLARSGQASCSATCINSRCRRACKTYVRPMYDRTERLTCTTRGVETLAVGQVA